MITSLLEQRKQELMGSKTYVPNDLYNYDKVVNRLKYHIENKSTIHIFGDYDVDGVTSTTIAHLVLSAHNVPHTYFIPSRKTDGYGIKPKHANNIQAEVVLLLDNGTTAHEAINILNRRGIEVIILDHHLTNEEPPDTEYIINPWLPMDKTEFKSICAAAITYFIFRDFTTDTKLYKYIKCLAGIGTIGDMMPLISINRYLAAQAYASLEATTGYAVDYLPTSSQLEYSLIPTLNAAGRMSDATLAVITLSSKCDIQSFTLAQKLISINDYRKSRAKEILSSVSVDTPYSIYIIHNDNIEEGMIGIVAGNITNRIYKPSIVISNGKGSVRSIPEVNIHEILSQYSSYLTSFGGHSQACGFSIEDVNIEKFIEAIHNINLPKVEKSLHWDNEIPLSDINFQTYKAIQSLKPFGHGNREPVFRTNGVRYSQARIVGKNSDTLQFLFPMGLRGVKFNTMVPPTSDIIDIIYTLTMHEWNGESYIQLNIQEVIENA